jgi:hypothetical protein
MNPERMPKRKRKYNKYFSLRVEMTEDQMREFYLGLA